MPCALYAGQLQDYAMESAYSNANVREATGKNDGPEIKTWLNYIGLNQGQPYCAAFVIWNYHVATQKLNAKDALPKYGRACMILHYAQKNPLKYKVITPNQLILTKIKLQAGDIPIHSRSPGKVYDFNGHAALVIEQVSPKKYKSIEANTSASYAGDQGEGEGVYRKERVPSNPKFPVKGFIRILH